MNTGLGGSAQFAVPSFATQTFLSLHFSGLSSLFEKMMALCQLISEVLPALTVSSSELYAESFEMLKCSVTKEYTPREQEAWLKEESSCSSVNGSRKWKLRNQTWCIRGIVSEENVIWRFQWGILWHRRVLRREGFKPVAGCCLLPLIGKSVDGKIQLPL